MTAASISPPSLRMDVPHTLHPAPAPTLDDTVYLSDEEGETVSSDTNHKVESTPMFVEKLNWYPSELIGRILLELFWSFSDYDPQRGGVLHRTLAACRLVCGQWKWIVKPIQESFLIRAYGKEWLSPSFPYYILPRTPLLLTDEGGANQEGNAGWLPENYTAELSQLHPKFLPDLVPNMIPEILRGNESLVQSTSAACCLVCQEWNRIFTPVLYTNIFLGGKKSLLTRSLLRRTFQHTKPTYKALVRAITIELADDGSTANSLSICFSFSFPNLHKLIIALPVVVDLATLHSNFAQNLQSLSRCCAVQMRGNFIEGIATEWRSFPIWINFFRRSRSILCGLFADPSGDKISYSKTHFYIEKQEASAHGGLYLSPSNPDSLPEIDLRKNPHLRLLQFDFSLWGKKIRDSHDDVIRWFNSICESVTSRSLVVGLEGLFKESEICNKIQDILLALHTRIETLTVFLSGRCFSGRYVDLKDMRKLFPRLHETGIVVEKWLVWNGDEARAIAFGR